MILFKALFLLLLFGVIILFFFGIKIIASIFQFFFQLKGSLKKEKWHNPSSSSDAQTEKPQPTTQEDRIKQQQRKKIENYPTEYVKYTEE